MFLHLALVNRVQFARDDPLPAHPEVAGACHALHAAVVSAYLEKLMPKVTQGAVPKRRGRPKKRGFPAAALAAVAASRKRAHVQQAETEEADLIDDSSASAAPVQQQPQLPDTGASSPSGEEAPATVPKEDNGAGGAIERGEEASASILSDYDDSDDDDNDDQSYDGNP